MERPLMCFVLSGDRLTPSSAGQAEHGDTEHGKGGGFGDGCGDAGVAPAGMAGESPQLKVDPVDVPIV